MTTGRTPALAVLVALTLPFTAAGQEVRNREANQQSRIGQGVASGQITAGGASRIEQRERALNATRRADLAAHGGHLTPSEYHHLNQRENTLSHRIYVDKHNNVAQPGVVPH
jgi:hypothetical protein